MREDKIKGVEDLKEKIGRSQAFYFLDFTAVPANDFNTFRRRAQKEGLSLKVVKNSLALLAFTACGVPEEIGKFLRGPTLIIFTDSEPVTPARLLQETRERLPGLKFKGAFFDNTFYPPEEFSFLLSLPTKKEARENIVQALLTPLAGLVGVLETLTGELVWVLEQARPMAESQEPSAKQ
ncbi:MAG: 50S ribosomal protein L10 [candidate division WOR-3 bacterium]